MAAPATAMKRAPLPPGYVGLRALIRTRRVTHAQAAANRTRPLTYARHPRRAQRGLIRLDAAALWKAVSAGRFPAPVIGPWGNAWPLDAVLRWRDEQ